MSMFSNAVTTHWLPAGAERLTASDARVVVDAALPENRTLSLLRIDGGPTIVTLTPERAAGLGLTDRERLAAADLGHRVAAATAIELHGADHLHYLPVEEQQRLRAEPPADDVRPPGIHPLTDADADAFTAFAAEAPEDDLDEAFVELDHWLVFGAFADGRLVGAASMYPWAGTRLADLGVITLPAFRGRGIARGLVRAISAAALDREHEPQYRCQLDNAPSVAFARSAGFARFGEWDVIATP